MLYQTHNQTEIQIGGTSLRGHIVITYDALYAVFGRPMGGDGYKTDIEWAIRFKDDVVATIYNWKNGPAYLGDDGTPVHEITEWNVGGHTTAAVDLVVSTLQQEGYTVQRR